MAKPESGYLVRANEKNQPRFRKEIQASVEELNVREGCAHAKEGASLSLPESCPWAEHPVC